MINENMFISMDIRIMNIILKEITIIVDIIIIVYVKNLFFTFIRSWLIPFSN